MWSSLLFLSKLFPCIFCWGHFKSWFEKLLFLALLFFGNVTVFIPVAYSRCLKKSKNIAIVEVVISKSYNTISFCQFGGHLSPRMSTSLYTSCLEGGFLVFASTGKYLKCELISVTCVACFLYSFPQASLRKNIENIFEPVLLSTEEFDRDYV